MNDTQEKKEILKLQQQEAQLLIGNRNQTTMKELPYETNEIIKLED